MVIPVLALPFVYQIKTLQLGLWFISFNKITCNQKKKEFTQSHLKFILINTINGKNVSIILVPLTMFITKKSCDSIMIHGNYTVCIKGTEI